MDTYLSALKYSNSYFNAFFRKAVNEEYLPDGMVRQLSPLTNAGELHNTTNALNLSIKDTLPDVVDKQNAPSNYEVVPLDLSLKSNRKSVSSSSQNRKNECCEFLQELGLGQVFPQKEDVDVTNQVSEESLTQVGTKKQWSPGNAELAFLSTDLRTCSNFALAKLSLEPSKLKGNGCRGCIKHYSCYMCDRSYKHARDYRAHLAAHKQGSIYNCDMCDRVLSNSSDYLLHLKTHRQKEVMSCAHCGKYFRDSCTLSTHMRIHTGEKPYRCNICEKRFTQAGTCRRHRKIHQHKL